MDCIIVFGCVFLILYVIFILGNLCRTKPETIIASSFNPSITSAKQSLSEPESEPESEPVSSSQVVVEMKNKNTNGRLTKRQKKQQKQEAAQKRLDLEIHKPWVDTVSRTKQVGNYCLDSIQTAHAEVNILFSKLVGQHTLCESDLTLSIQQFEESLAGKNVNSKTAEQIGIRLKSSLLGEKLPSCQSIMQTIRSRFTEQLKELIPNDFVGTRPSEKLLQLIQEKTHLFIILAIGTNGVGKSTSLGKICKWLQSHNFQASFAPCDTFRAGAIEQLTIHAKALKVELYPAQYNEPITKVAVRAKAMALARQDDILLIDSAGRMGGNNKLMTELGNLIKTVQPDYVLYIIEAIAGNESTHELEIFNKKITDTRNGGRGIDGVLLSKFDTVDNQIGAVLNILVTSKIPILFVGTGQTYSDLKTIEMNNIVDMILK